ncbi:MAG: glycogen debranching enzyme GlgX, partial [Flavisolibacter sp.]|nr:glycogen debranching enzyme GlgX [Flavisolibacter sp.]
LVSYNEKHNEANKENNNDGEKHNSSWNCGVEGPSDDPQVNALRDKQKRNFLTTLFLSQGVPMIVAGDEISRTQQGNNNAYCQDNELSWINWKAADTKLLNYTTRLIHFYKSHPVFSRRKWFKGLPIKGTGVEDIAWFQPGGEEMDEENWQLDFAKSLGVYLNGNGIRSSGPKGEAIVDDSFYIIFNGAHHDLNFKLPAKKFGSTWIKLIDTSLDQVDEPTEIHTAEETIRVPDRSVLLFKHPLS